jgi:hypothetical protein
MDLTKAFKQFRELLGLSVQFDKLKGSVNIKPVDIYNGKLILL